MELTKKPIRQASMGGYGLSWQGKRLAVLRVNDLSGFVARNLSGRHSAPQGVRHETNGGATGDTEDEIRGSV